MVATALARGHQITMFNRGRTNPDLFPEAEKLHGDRDGGLDALLSGGEGVVRTWDAVIDTCGYVPRVVRQSAEALRDRVPLYVFISTISVYDLEGGTGISIPVKENSPFATMPDETVETIDGETYGPLKALCERVVQEAYGDSALIVRPGLIVGPWDKTDRFTYWAGPYRRGRRRARSGPARSASPVHRRARSRRVDGFDGGAASPLLLGAERQ